MNNNFLNYIKNEFFLEDEESFKNFLQTYSIPLKKSIRVNTNLVSIKDFLEKTKDILTLQKTDFWENMFFVESYNKNKSIWNSFFHINWFFYIQELAASSSVYYLSWDKKDFWEYIIVDMASSPWWKTTQLREYFPNSIIISNEIDKQRLPQLFTNIEKSKNDNIVITNYDARFFRNYKEFFDKIILDAPCSWEWTCYKSLDAIKFWNIKNIKNIAKLQLQLLISAWNRLKIWWEMIFSTCTLNKIENEWVLKDFLDLYKDSFDIVLLEDNFWNKKETIRLWPHINNTWWFFVVKLRKKSSILLKKEEKTIKMPSIRFDRLTPKEEKNIISYLQEKVWVIFEEEYFFYKVWNYIYASKKNFSVLTENNIYIIKWWVNIWELESWVFKISSYVSIFKTKNILDLDYENMLKYIWWENLEISIETKYDYIFLSYKNLVFSIWKKWQNNIINMFPKKFITNNI